LKPSGNVGWQCTSARTFVPGWEPTPAALITRLREDYGWASEHVSHIGYLKQDEPLVNILPDILRVRAGKLLDVIEEFVEALEAAKSPYAPTVRLGLNEARRGL
jgi:hypothetical protein